MTRHTLWHDGQSEGQSICSEATAADATRLRKVHVLDFASSAGTDCAVLDITRGQYKRFVLSIFKAHRSFEKSKFLDFKKSNLKKSYT